MSSPSPLCQLATFLQSDSGGSDSTAGRIRLELYAAWTLPLSYAVTYYVSFPEIPASAESETKCVVNSSPATHQTLLQQQSGTRVICRLCFVLIYSALWNLLCVWMYRSKEEPEKTVAFIFQTGLSV